jgi:site-specific recombinase XerD
VQGAFREALRDRGSPKQAAAHPLRHAWATHWREAGVTLRLMQAYRGHHSPTPTSGYTRLTASADHLGVAAIHRLMGAV